MPPPIFGLMTTRHGVTTRSTRDGQEAGVRGQLGCDGEKPGQCGRYEAADDLQPDAAGEEVRFVRASRSRTAKYGGPVFARAVARDEAGRVDVVVDSTVSEQVQVGQARMAEHEELYYDVWASFSMTNPEIGPTKRDSGRSLPKTERSMTARFGTPLHRHDRGAAAKAHSSRTPACNSK